MNIPKRGLAGFKENWRKDLFAGFVVSLIALPLALGLAIASGAPPVAGIIAAVVGGIFMAFFGGSFVTITGPGNGLAVATFAAITLLGQNNADQGWLFTMAAIVMSGIVLFVLGVLRFGSLSDFFPSAAVEGMLGAIGLIILARQLHVMLGLDIDAENTLSFLMLVPDTVSWLFTDGSLFVAAIGVLSLVIMAGYSTIRSKWLHLVPAPMWVVVLGVLLSFVLQWTGNQDLLPKEMTIVIPENLFDQYQAPDFSLIGTGNFWMAVITLTLIASIESLLSIKGIERLDVYKRKANTNKDLRAHGLATTLSGILGGLNVVTVIARSSVNVNNGAQTRNSNLFHAVILAFVILFMQDFVSRIPRPALAAILVYTGYKLASPASVSRISKMGWEAMAVYSITFVTTIYKGIIPGIVCGIFATFILQLITTKRAGLILRNIFRPNALLYTEENGTYILSVKKYANFLNFSRIRSKMDSIPGGSNVIVDFTLCEFIDNSVMEHLHGYNAIHEMKGGSVEIVGLDDLEAASNHPFAPWVPIVGNKPNKQKVLSKRQKSLRLFAQELNMSFEPSGDSTTSDLNKFGYFQTKSLDQIRNVVFGKVSDAEIRVCDLDYHMGEFIVFEAVHTSLITIKFNFDIPDFILHEEDFFDRMGDALKHEDIDFVKHVDFSNRFLLKGPHPELVKAFFKEKLIRFFESSKSFNLECKNNEILIFEKERLAGISEIKLMVSFAIRLAELIQVLQKK